MRLLLDVMSFERQPDFRNPRPWATGGLAAGTAALAIRSVLHHRGSVRTDRPIHRAERRPRARAVDSTNTRKSSRALAAKTSMSG
jgi:hypothetical protein